MLQDSPDLQYPDDNTGLFAVPPRHATKHSNSMTKKTIPLRSSAPLIALSDSKLAIANLKTLKIIDLAKYSAVEADLPGITVLEVGSNGDFVVGLHSGSVYEIDDDLTVEHSVSVNFPIGSIVLSVGAPNFAVCDLTRQRIAWGGDTLAFEQPPVDLAVNGEDLYIAHASRVEYRTSEYFVSAGSALTVWEADRTISSVAVDPNAFLLGVCADDQLFLLDRRAPRLISTTWIPDARKFIPSPFSGIAAVVTSQGFTTIDLRKPEAEIARCKLSAVPTSVAAEWIPRSRLMAVAFAGHFFVCSPYVRSQVLECYPIENEPVVRVHANLTACVVHQQSSLTLFGGYGTHLKFPDCVFE
jgi:hypothetical protein